MKILKISILLAAWTCHAFQTAPPRPGRLSAIRSSILEDEDQIIDAEIENYESARLTKAKQLLEQFTMEQAQRQGSNGKKLVLAANGRNATTSAAITTVAIEVDDSDNVVPDQFWRNGHLQGG